ncbi:hypothetical protein [Heyndrickxia camelliae]|uniref:Uncharacterized protein n=1 Tax=Heyndrickxia camelliae TaxID=1707093 RepID=A0A2N3LJ50_9BACI|nr:hypothetical protein [Heyndrickxia camelliae]PKR84563.1 hypothetical protein CWO92_12670 [Heyndrickxia camelliae]
MDRDRDYHDRDPHLDAPYEGIVNDSTGGPTMGLKFDLSYKNPFHVTSLRKDEEMERFSKYFDGKMDNNTDGG